MLEDLDLNAIHDEIVRKQVRQLLNLVEKLSVDYELCEKRTRLCEMKASFLGQLPYSLSILWASSPPRSSQPASSEIKENPQKWNNDGYSIRKTSSSSPTCQSRE
jgi:hypothetical protein